MENYVDNTAKKFIYSLNSSDLFTNLNYFSIQNEKHEEAKFYCEIKNIEMAVDIIDLTCRKLNLPEIEKNHLCSNFITKY